MKQLLLLFLYIQLCSSHCLSAHTMFVGATNGLSLRSDKNTNSSVIAKIRYGENVVVDSLLDQVVVDGFSTNWAAVKYDGKQGYLVYAYLIPIPPPAKSVDELKKYAEQLSEKACNPVINIEGDARHSSVADEKTIYKNGFVHIVHNNYEYLSESLIIPDMSIKQAFMIVQNIAHLKDFLPKDGKFPYLAYSKKSNNGNYRQIFLEYYEDVDKTYKRLEKVKFIADEQEVNGSLSIIELNGQVIIMYEYGS